MAVKPLPSSDTLLIILILLVLAGLTQWLVWLQKREERVEVFIGPPRSEYTLNEFEMRALDNNGQLRFVLNAPRLVRDGRDGAFWIESPQFEILDASAKAWHATAKTAWVQGDTDILELREDVVVETGKESDKPLVLHSEKLRADLLKQQLETNLAVTATQAGVILNSTGLRADMKTERIQLLEDVHAKLTPAPQ